MSRDSFPIWLGSCWNWAMIILFQCNLSLMCLFPPQVEAWILIYVHPTSAAWKYLMITWPWTWMLSCQILSVLQAQSLGWPEISWKVRSHEGENEKRESKKRYLLLGWLGTFKSDQKDTLCVADLTFKLLLIIHLCMTHHNFKMQSPLLTLNFWYSFLHCEFMLR